jgi:hypothetical protein
MTFHALKPSDPYYSQWLDYHQRERQELNWTGYFSGVAGLIYLAVILLWPGKRSSIAVIWLVVWVTIIAIRGDRLAHWPCPRCGQPFKRRPGWRIGLERGCVYCGLPMWAPDDSAPDLGAGK